MARIFDLKLTQIKGEFLGEDVAAMLQTVASFVEQHDAHNEELTVGGKATLINFDETIKAEWQYSDVGD